MRVRFDRSNVTRVLSVLVLLALGLGQIGCNTTEGVGKDVKAGGRALEDAAHDAKP